MKSVVRGVATSVAAACAATLLFHVVHAEQAASVPFVGCKSAGQTDVVFNAPARATKTIQISQALANRLAYYQAETGPGVLGPRGWRCFGVYGSNGATLYVTTDLLDSVLALSSTWKGFSGAAIQISKDSADTSGRFRAARFAARVFPVERRFVQSVIDEKIESAANFPIGPYPTDRLRYQSNHVVEYQTPPRTKGLGTDSRLQVGRDPIYGAAIFEDSDPALITLAVRLPRPLKPLVAPIVQQMIRENSQTK